jgi:hypothetical protein
MYGFPFVISKTDLSVDQVGSKTRVFYGGGCVGREAAITSQGNGYSKGNQSSVANLFC